jgi:hypothetical protein
MRRVQADVIERRSLAWAGMTAEVDAVRVGSDPLAPSAEFLISIWTNAVTPDAIDALAMAPASLDGVRAASLDLERREEGVIHFRAHLAETLPALLLTPAHPARSGDISFSDALRIARTVGYPVVLSGVTEAERYWYFPWRQIGSIGGVVEKAAGRLTVFGSAWPVDDWIWAYEHGLLEHDYLDFVVDEVLDLPAAVDVIRALRVVRNRRRRDVEQALTSTPPIIFPDLLLGSSIGVLRRADRAFRWHAAAPISARGRKA